MLNEVLDWMGLKENGIYCDCTVGGGGHLTAMLKSTKTAKFIGVDCDPAAIDYSRRQTVGFSKRCWLFEDNFINLDLILDKLNIALVNGILFDLGVSYHQVTTASRGFSFERQGRLLMRMSPRYLALSEKLRRSSKEEVARILKEYGDVRNYRRLGREIYEHRVHLTSTLELRNLIENAVPRRFLKKNLHKVFQALRIWTNDELNNLRLGLVVALQSLHRGGRMLVISYHSGEDRIVKRFFRDKSKEGKVVLLRKKAVKPLDNEVKVNPSARSAKLRMIEKCGS
ncbi:MAG: 16S rRNA (cytosine(1402)-N(4))-methyltransferase RsmH [candidate division WOR-3 bacterium]|nr:MAG: 16S rRNA (cytosine(1402)-N(4))-methyltransferase RsmH [candidate division WOR-3 bacterium]